MSDLTFIGLDVDTEAFHVAVLLKEDLHEFRCKPTAVALLKKIELLKLDPSKLRFCYEAGYLGFSLQRQLTKAGANCVVVAPSLIPRTPGQSVKTDRIDARKLARLYQNNLLTLVHVPSTDEEMVRDLIRTREFIQDQVSRLKKVIISLCRKYQMDYKEGRKTSTHGRCTYWTHEHHAWLSKSISEMTNLVGKVNLKMLVCELNRVKTLVEYYDSEIQKIAENDVKYIQKVKALQSFRGIQLIQAMILITEIGDINRFSHPNKIVSYCGMDLREYSSGGSHHRFSMSKLGNRQIRTALIIAAQFAKLPPKVSKSLKSRRNGTPSEVVAVAERAMLRLYKKSNNLAYRGKHSNQIKGACARELVGFVWEALRMS